MVCLEAFGLEITVGLKSGDKCGDVIVHSPKMDVYSQTDEHIRIRDVGDFFYAIENAPTRKDFAKLSKAVNEICVFYKVCENPYTMSIILNGLNMGLIPQEKEMVAFGENRGGLEDFELEYADIVDDLHRACEEIDFEEVEYATDYVIARKVCDYFFNVMFTSSTGLPYNRVLHQNWNHEYGTDI